MKLNTIVCACILAAVTNYAVEVDDAQLETFRAMAKSFGFELVPENQHRRLQDEDDFMSASNQCLTTQVVDLREEVDLLTTNLQEAQDDNLRIHAELEALKGEVSRAPAGHTTAYNSCLAVKQDRPDAPSGNYLLGLPFLWSAYCDMETDGGGWTIVAAYPRKYRTGDHCIPCDSEVGANNNPLQFLEYNTNHAKKMALQTSATESLFLRDNGTWIKANRGLFDDQLNTATTQEWDVVVTANDGTQDTGAKMGYSTQNHGSGGDFGIVSTSFDRHGSNYLLLNSGCANHYVYSYGNQRAYKVNQALGTWLNQKECGDNDHCASCDEGIAFYVAMR